MGKNIDDSKLSITIDYKIGEYFEVLRESLYADTNVDLNKSWYIKPFAYLVWASVFWFKVIRMGTCIFTYDNDGFKRSSNTGINVLKWQELKEIVDLPQSFVLVGKTKGMIPIPKRCFSHSQKACFIEWTESKRVNHLS